MPRNQKPALSRETIIERAISSTTNAVLDEWNELPVSIAAEVMETVIDRLITELVAFKESNAL